ncbi:MAG: alanine--tRNA ligase, partial [Thermoleophilaceae bacterium]|nr:alanine--tRNA ligase [Thermoleophilaceae bacterium]
YVLRRIMRRAIQQTRPLGIESELLSPLCERVIEVMGEAYPELHTERETILGWAAAEEAGFARTLRQGETLLGELISEAKGSGAAEISAAAVFQLHDTYGFPSEMTKEMIAPHGLTVDEPAFEALMERARTVSRAGGGSSASTNGTLPSRDEAFEFAREAGFETDFKGYEKTAVETVLGAVRSGSDGTLLVKLEESPFYPEGGGQISDSGFVETDRGRGRVAGVYRLGDDQVLAIVPETGTIEPGETARAEVDRGARLATEANHTATHLLHAALRERLGDHVRQAGSYVGPDKLRFDFNHGERMSSAELADVEQRVNGWILQNSRVHAISTTLDEARSLGAMALFGEKYGDIVRMVEIASVSRELCGGTHVASSGEIGLFHLTGETSSASNVRRIEATTGPVSAALFAERNRQVAEISELLRAPESAIVENVRRLAERVKDLERRSAEPTTDHSEALLAAATPIGGVPVVVEPVEELDAKALLALSDRVRQKLGDAAVVLGSSTEGRVHLVANVAEGVVARGLEAGDLVKLAAEIVGGGGGGRPTMAQAGGRDPAKLGEALAAARTRIEGVLG